MKRLIEKGFELSKEIGHTSVDISSTHMLQNARDCCTVA